MKKINWGIIGLGNVALEFAKSFDKIKNAQLVSIASKDNNKIKIFQDRFKIDKNFIFHDYEDLLDCEIEDIIYIALPNSHHYKWIMKCIEKKKKNIDRKASSTKFY